MSKYATGADMWREYREQYGDAEARGICNRYLDLQVKNTDPGELEFCRELYAAMQTDLPMREAPASAGHSPATFAYGGYHFTPVRQFRKGEGDFFTISQRQYTDFDLGLSTYDWQKARYSYDDFYAASTDKSCDIFRCEETGRLYVPGANELFGYHEPPQRSRAVKKSVVGALEQAKRDPPAPAAAQKPAPQRKGGER